MSEQITSCTANSECATNDKNKICKNEICVECAKSADCESDYYCNSSDNICKKKGFFDLYPWVFPLVAVAIGLSFFLLNYLNARVPEVGLSNVEL